ncbi:pyridoxamine 5'-phosphate oxidase family protein [Pedobacter namyangjuensis]|uniref:pyridoxamine 5'-phosphate oxidase family protein n=1 Tax=Pedobacter namyangjuensis TaxID=600626 RepID=UPI000DE5721F|nr:pyridoxamine 5'-phosphate oxidase family protein [Pedobacter namyangjuensis]
MLGELNKRAIIDLLENNFIGRVGCHADGETYIAPINYIYRDGAIYAHSGPGKKIDMMRKTPKVCFQVDEIDDTFRWQSILVQGNYEELSGAERQQVLQELIKSISSRRDKPSQGPSHAIDPAHQQELIVYRIKIQEASGRYETH